MGKNHHATGTKSLKADMNRADEVTAAWETGWKALFDTITQLMPNDLSKTVYIRSQPLTVIQAIERGDTTFRITSAKLSIWLSKFVMKIGKP